MALDDNDITILYKDMQAWTKKWARAHYRSIDYAEILLQDTMVKILRNRENIRPDTMLAYAKTAAENLSKDRRKKKFIPIEPLSDNTKNIKDTSVHKRTGNQLISADFPRGYFTEVEEAAVAMGLEGFTQEETAERLEVSRSEIVRALDSAIIKANL